MHREAYDFVERTVRTIDPPLEIVDLGGQDVNSTNRRMVLRDLFDDKAKYTTVDMVDGPGVTVVGPAQTYHHPRPVDLVLCTELLEHTPDGAAILSNAFAMLRPGGHIILTCATDPRPPHSAWGDPQPREHEYYGNVNVVSLERWFNEAGFTGLSIWTNLRHHDLYALASKPC